MTSFPYAGMENPMYTFVHPAIFYGNHEKVIIHEMVHSWFGNTVSCENWGNMWINEVYSYFPLNRVIQLL